MLRTFTKAEDGIVNSITLLQQESWHDQLSFMHLPHYFLLAYLEYFKANFRLTQLINSSV
jgi:hypothetical protein